MLSGNLSDLVRFRKFVLAFAVGMISSSNLHAQVEISRFYPPVVSVGGETTITADGKFPQWPVELVCDRDDVDVRASTESGKLIVKTQPSAGPGIAWIRGFDATSASKLMPLLIEPSSTIAEGEANNKISEATAISLPVVAYGRLEKSGDIDSYRFKLSKGNTFVASLVANQWLRSPMDAVLQLVDVHGNVIVQADDGRGLDPQCVFTTDRDIDLILRVFAFPETPNSTIGYAGDASFVYAIRITEGACVDHVLPLVTSSDDTADSILAFGWNLPPKLEKPLRVNNGLIDSIASVGSAMGWQSQTLGPPESISIQETGTGAAAVAPSLPCVFSGHIMTRGEVDRLRLTVEASKRYQATVHSRAFGFPLDSVIRIVNVSDQSELARNDDASRDRYDASIEFMPKVSGEVELQIHDLVDGFGLRHAYSVLVEQIRPSVELTVAEERFTIKAGESIEIPITIARSHDFADELSIAAKGLPEGIVSIAAVSESKGATSKAVSLKLTATANAVYQGSFQIVATTADQSKIPAFYRLRDTVKAKDFWLTAHVPSK